MENYDIIIIGGGLAGLSLGSKLANKHKVLLLEKEMIRDKIRTIMTLQKFVPKDLLQFVERKFTNPYTNTVMYKEKLCVRSTFVSLNEEKVKKYFENNILKSGGIINENEKVIKLLEHKKGKAVIETNKSKYECKLLIDCTGYNSILAKKMDIYGRRFFYTVYGTEHKYEIPNEDAILLSMYQDTNVGYYFQAQPAKENTTITYTFTFSNKPREMKDLMYNHYENLEKCPISERFNHGFLEYKGIIAGGILKKQAVDNIYFFGDSSLLAPSLGGFGATHILKNYKKIAKHLSDRLNENKLKARNLKYKYDLRTRYNKILLDTAAGISIHLKPYEKAKLINTTSKNGGSFFLKLTVQDFEIKDAFKLFKLLVKDIGFLKLFLMLNVTEYVCTLKGVLKMGYYSLISNFKK